MTDVTAIGKSYLQLFEYYVYLIFDICIVRWPYYTLSIAIVVL